MDGLTNEVGVGLDVCVEMCTNMCIDGLPTRACRRLRRKDLSPSLAPPCPPVRQTTLCAYVRACVRACVCACLRAFAREAGAAAALRRLGAVRVKQPCRECVHESVHNRHDMHTQTHDRALRLELQGWSYKAGATTSREG